MRPGRAALFAVSLVSLVSLVAARPVVAAETAPPTPPDLRLDDSVRPTHYSLDLRIVPTEPRLSGTVVIDVVMTKPMSVIWLNATGPIVSAASIDGAPATVIPGNDAFIGLQLAKPAGPGTATLRLAFDAPMPDDEDSGIYRQEEAGNHYVFTQFEASDARHAFPCFDQPNFKTPWLVTLHVRQEDAAFANAPQKLETPEEGGMKSLRFDETLPMPSYLVALAVGPLEIVDGGRVGAKATPLRFIVPKGRTGEAAWAKEATGPLLVKLEEYFGSAYPFPKLDVIAVPQKGGAMENPGLITYGQSGMLCKPEEDTVSRRRGYASTIAHEMAHMWFGDLVTTRWWDDIWLNEAFATWMERKTVAKWKPEWRYDVSRLRTRSGAMGSDSLVSARKIRQPIETFHDIQGAFDNITYGKGASVLYMFEQWVGEEKFRLGVQRYLKDHAWGNGTASDFLAAISADAGFDVAPSFSTFLDQAGTPLVTADLVETDDKWSLHLEQQRYLPEGSEGSADELWQVPVCVRWSGGDAPTCTLLSTRSADLALPGMHAKPAWLLANAGENGYYRVRYRGDLLARLVGPGWKDLTLPEKVGLLSDLEALVDSGDVPVTTGLDLVPRLAKESSYHLLSAAVGIASSVNEEMIPDNLRANYARFLRRCFGARARQLGFAAGADEDEETRLLRPRLIGLVADEGEDTVLQRQASALALRWLDDHGAVEADMVGTVLELAATHADKPLFDRLHAEAAAAKDRKERGRFLGAMGSVRDPALARKALEIALSGEFEIREAATLWRGLASQRQTRALAYDFVKAHFDEIAEKLPRERRAGLLRMGSSPCEKAHRDEFAATFGPRADAILNGPRTMAQVLERMDLCIAQVEAQRADVAKFLRKW